MGWIFSKKLDVLAFLGPVLLTWALIAVIYSFTKLDHGPTSFAVLAALYLLVDVPHVYALLFRTYADKKQFKKNKRLFIAVPVICLILGIVIHSYSSDIFWRIVVYLAIFHFIRQQYGWMALTRYKSKEKTHARLDKIMIYNCMLVPLLWWHAHPNSFGWFEPGDILAIVPLDIANTLLIIHWVIIAGYIAHLIYQKSKSKSLNHAKLLIILTTWMTWYIPLVFLNVKYYLIAATAQILAHGIPYIVLLFKYSKSRFKEERSFVASIFTENKVVVFYLLLVSAALLEKGLWYVIGEGYGRDHQALIQTSQIILTILVPLFAIPQLTHYILDGFVWRPKKDPELKQHLKLK